MTVPSTARTGYRTTMETVASRDGTTIAYDRRGDGPPVVIVGGALSDRRAAGELVDRLAPGLTAIAYDRRGRGDSTDTPPYAVEREIEDLDALIQAVGGSAFVFGHSSGGGLALRAAEAGLAIPRLAVYEPPFIVDDTRPPMPDDYVSHVDALVESGRHGEAVEYFLTVGPQVPASVIERSRESPAWAGMCAMAPTITYDGRVMADTMLGDPAPLRRWSSLATPTLVLDGGDSPAWMHHSAAALAAVLPDATTATLPGQTHGAEPAVLAPVLLEFFLGG
jgi:pimeloyl-ACP methyl ester carboxylesterase